jgi:hypothetical protein
VVGTPGSLVDVPVGVDESLVVGERVASLPDCSAVVSDDAAVVSIAGEPVGE